MKFLWFNFETKKELRDQIRDLVSENAYLIESNMKAHAELTDYQKKYPLVIGETVYELKRKDSSGKFTKKNVSKEHSTIEPITVTKKNYFGLVDRFLKLDVFVSEDDAIEYLDEIC